MKDYQFLQQKYLVNAYVNRGLTIVRGEGVYLYTDTGERYLDLMGNYGVNVFGYNHPGITKPLQEQIARIITLHGSFANDCRAHAAELLVKRCGGNLFHVYFSSSGAEAVEAALKFAVLATGKHHFVAGNRGYHGKTFGALSATSGEKYRKPFEPLLGNFSFVDFNNESQLEATITDQTAAVILEPIQGEGGIHIPHSEYLSRVRALCRSRGVLLIIDEIQSGMGRTGSFLASQGSLVDYDILCLGKGLAGGLPVGATLVSSAINNAIPRTVHTSTFGGNPLSCAGISAALGILDDTLLSHITSTGSYLCNAVSQLNHPYITEVRGIGFMIGIEMKSHRNELIKFLQQNNILVIPSGDNVIRLLPPFLIANEHADQFVSVLKKFR